MSTVSYNNIKQFLINTLKFPEQTITDFLNYNKIVFKRYETKINNKNVNLDVNNNGTKTTVNISTLMIEDIQQSTTYRKY